MPLVQPTKITRPEELVEFLHFYLSNSQLPIAYLAKYDEPLIPEYPAVIIMSAPLQKQVHGTHTWLLTLRAEIYVMHAKMTEDRATRNYEDLVLATNIVSFLERDMSLGRRVIEGWIESETPGAMPPRSEKGSVVISTKLLWAGKNESRF